MSAPSAFKRYNQVQKALSAHSKELGYSFKGSGRNFSQIASSVYRDNSGRDLDTIVQEIFRGHEPIMPPSFFECFPFFDFDASKPKSYGKWNPNFQPDNLIIQSPQIIGHEVPAQELTYEDHFSDFTAYCNANHNIWWDDSEDPPSVRFTEPEWDPKGKRWLSTLETCEPDAYGYEPGMGAVEYDWEKMEAPEEIIEPVTPKEEVIEAKKVAAHKRTAKIKALDLKIKKVEAKIETKKAKGKKDALKILKRYEKYYKQGIISKSEFKMKVLELKI